jgi:Holliday junction resolvase RusA-like endonuclease
MNRVVTFVIPDKAEGKDRARSTRTGHHYTTNKTRSYEDKVGWLAKQAWAGEPSLKPMEIRIQVYVEPPKSWSKKRRAKAIFFDTPYLSKPDNDNIEKAIWDAMRGIVYKDDSQIYNNSCRKFYEAKSETYVIITEHSEFE